MLDANTIGDGGEFGGGASMITGISSCLADLLHHDHQKQHASSLDVPGIWGLKCQK